MSESSVLGLEQWVGGRNVRVAHNRRWVAETQAQQSWAVKWPLLFSLGLTAGSHLRSYLVPLLL